MTTNGNGHYDLAGTELADDGLDLVQKLESHLSIHPEDSETRGALQQLFAAPVVKPIRLWDWTMAPEAKPIEWLVENWLPAGRGRTRATYWVRLIKPWLSALVAPDGYSITMTKHFERAGMHY